ncbi:glycerate kinase [Nocardioides convexus]|uniref:glycerate kinase n=1 Tax=Nocardioides convexus TaxID=2712224 RepID=UPI0024182016|nr:glycerate kinase [Nocardioides convexus]
MTLTLPGGFVRTLAGHLAGSRHSTSDPQAGLTARRSRPRDRPVRHDGAMRVLVAPDKFAGTLTAVEAAEAMAEGWRRQSPDDEVVLAPMSDGGPGFVDVLHASLGGEPARRGGRGTAGPGPRGAGHHPPHRRHGVRRERPGLRHPPHRGCPR